MNGIRLKISGTLSAAELHRRGREELDHAAPARMLAIAHALEGTTRAEAARLAGMERQALRDAVLRYNAEGLDGLHDRPRSGAVPPLDGGRMAQLRQLVVDGPDVEKCHCTLKPARQSGTTQRAAMIVSRHAARKRCGDDIWRLVTRV